MLAHLLRENQQRSIDPQAYTTPASVFNTVAVDFAEHLPEKRPDIVDKLINPDSAESIDIPLQTVPIPVASLHKLDPVAPAQPDDTLTVVVGARESCDNLCQNVSPRTDTSTSSRTPQSEAESLPSEPYANRVRSLERNTRSALSTAERAPVRMGSLERNARGSLSHRGSPVPIAPFTRQHSVPASPPPRNRRDQDVGQFSVQGALNAQLAASVVNKMRHQPEPPLVEEIYDFGGDNVKSCVAIAAHRAGINKPQYRQGGPMSASHPSNYGVPVGIVQGVPYSQAMASAMSKPGHVAVPVSRQMYSPPITSSQYYPPCSSSPGLHFPQMSPQPFPQMSPQPFPQMSPQPFPQVASSQPMGVIPPMTFSQQSYSTHNVIHGPPQPMLYRPQVSSSQATIASQVGVAQQQLGVAQSQVGMAQSQLDSPHLPQPQGGTQSQMYGVYASRQECTPIQPTSTQIPQVVQVTTSKCRIFSIFFCSFLFSFSFRFYKIL